MLLFEPVRDRKLAPPLTDQIVSTIQDAIQSQQLRPGMAVPSVRQFARDYGVSTFTVAAAYNRLVAKGHLSSRPGAGYRVAGPARSLSAPAPAQWHPPAVGASWLLADVFADHSIPIKSGCGWLPSEWLNESGLRYALRDMARTPAGRMGGYGHPYGYYPLREQVAQSLERHGFNVLAEQVLLTQGATQALDIVIRTLLTAGDVVLVEVPAYANFLHTLRMAGMVVVGVTRNADGLCVDELEQQASRHRAKALFVNTVLHNPTGTSLTMSNAYRVLQLAEHYDFWVIEDDVSRELLPGSGPLLAAMAGTRRVIYVSGFSKSITPALRVGYLVAAPDMVPEFAKTKMIMGLTTPETLERVAHEVLQQGQHRAHLQRVQERLCQAHDTLTDTMDRYGLDVFSRPRAGLFLWARMPEYAGQPRGATLIAQEALLHGIWLAPGAYFYPNTAQKSVNMSSDSDPSWIRFNVAYSLQPELWAFIEHYMHKTAPDAGGR